MKPRSPDLAPKLGRQLAVRNFAGAPTSVANWVSAVLEPLVSVLCLLALHRLHGVAFGRWATALSLMVMALTFPGRVAFAGSAWRLAADIARSWVVLLSLLLLCAVALGALQELAWPMLGEWALATPVLHWAARMLLAGVVARHARRDASERTAVIVGGGALGLRTAEALQRRPDEGARVVGYFDDRTGDRLIAAARPHRLGGLGEAGRYVSKLGIREVYITLPIAASPRLVALIDALQMTNASIYVVPDVFSAQIVQGRLKELDGLAVVGICESPFTGVNELVKRLSDIGIALALLCLTWPVMVAITVTLWLTVQGPAIGRQRRSGLNGEEITLYRFGAAGSGIGNPAEDWRGPGTAWSAGFDGWLRRTALDGLPLLLNVLQGRLSMVGPRAQAVVDGRSSLGSVPAYMVRHKARPGITGWAQVNGIRGDGDGVEQMRDRLDLDLAYLRSWSFALDLHILLLTLKAYPLGRTDD
jgi:putative colanic acid biosynthesis UDP-glucose lipid carrier transferase